MAIDKEAAFRTYSVIVAILIFLIGGIVYLTSAGFSIDATIEENQYIYYMARRDRIAYDLYHDAAETENRLYEIEDITNYLSRENEISELIDIYTELKIDAEKIMEFDQKMVDLDLGEELTEASAETFQTDSDLLTDITNALQFLENLETVNSTLLDISTSEECHSNIDFTAGNSAISNALAQCISDSESITVDDTKLPFTSQYITKLVELWKVEKTLYEELAAKDTFNATTLNAEIKTKQATVNNLKTKSVNEIRDYITGFSN